MAIKDELLLPFHTDYDAYLEDELGDKAALERDEVLTAYVVEQLEHIERLVAEHAAEIVFEVVQKLMPKQLFDDPNYLKTFITETMSEETDKFIANVHDTVSKASVGIVHGAVGKYINNLLAERNANVENLLNDADTDLEYILDKIDSYNNRSEVSSLLDVLKGILGEDVVKNLVVFDGNAECVSGNCPVDTDGDETT
jgi:hypothetical protein